MKNVKHVNRYMASVIAMLWPFGKPKEKVKTPESSFRLPSPRRDGFHTRKTRDSRPPYVRYRKDSHVEEA